VLWIVCWSCGRANRLTIRRGVPRCGACHVSLSLLGPSGVVVSPQYPVPSCRSLSDLFRFVRQNKRLPSLKKEWAEIRAFETLVRIHNELCEKRRQERRQEAQERERRLWEEKVAKEHWVKIHQSMRIAVVSEMGGLEFERYSRSIFVTHG
jgi:hypothetical protein